MMCGGIIVQKVGDAVEVMDETYFDRCWRRLEKPDEVKVGDYLWWQSHTGYLGRDGEFSDLNIGRCTSCPPHGRTPEPETKTG